MIPTLRIRQSSIKEFLRCRRKWAFDYLESIEAQRDPNAPHPHFALGHVLHTAIETYWQGGNPMHVVLEIEAAVIQAANANGEYLSKEWVDIFALLRAMVSGYPGWAESGEFHNIKVLDTEQDMEWHVGEINGIDVTVTGTVDRIEQDIFTEGRGVVDIKSTQSFQRSNTHSFQLLTYSVLVQETLDWTPDFLITEQIKKVKRTGQAKPPFYNRIETYVNDAMIANHRETLYEILQDMTMLVGRYNFVGMESKGLYPNRTKDCGWDCSYLAPCTALDDGSNYQNIILTNFKKKEPASA